MGGANDDIHAWALINSNKELYHRLSIYNPSLHICCGEKWKEVFRNCTYVYTVPIVNQICWPHTTPDLHCICVIQKTGVFVWLSQDDIFSVIWADQMCYADLHFIAIVHLLFINNYQFVDYISTSNVKLPFKSFVSYGSLQLFCHDIENPQ